MEGVWYITVGIFTNKSTLPTKQFVELLFYRMKPECFGNFLKMLGSPLRKGEGGLRVTGSEHRPA